MTTAGEEVQEKRLTQIIADQVRYRTMMGQRTWKVEEQEKLGKISDIRQTLRLDPERARLVTQAYKASEGEPISLRRAKSIAHYLDNMTIYINYYDRFA
ncbi:MAG: hypothetical protein JSW38_13220, partial [Dehalococcoidia bacterium]